MITKFFTNENENTLIKRFAGVFENIPNIEFFDALVGYFRASGYFAIRPYLDSIPNIRIMVGINVDRVVANYHSKGLLFKADHQLALDDLNFAIKNDIQTSNYSKETEDGIKKFLEDVISGKVRVKAHPHRKLHAKIYIFRPQNFNEYATGEVITGSSNLTDAGLGSSSISNYEFNVALRDYTDVKFASDEFEKLWNEGVDVLPVDMERIKKETYVNEEFTPFEVYYKFLIEYFGKSVEFDPNSVGDLPGNFKRLSYQIDAVEQGFEFLKKHNGFFLADVVGLGKTIIATLIAKKYFYYNNFPSHISTILIVTPPALKHNWRETFETFGVKNYDIITNGSLHKIKRPEKYDIILVDEAHKFRNDTAEAYNELQKLCKTPTTQRMKNGSRAMKKVILISATPLNNRPADIRNLLLLFQDGKRSTLEVSNLTSYFSKKVEEFKKAQHLQVEEARKEVAKIYEEIRERIIKPITIRRTRTDLDEHEVYKIDLVNQGITFPAICPPEKILYQLEPNLEELYDFTILMLSDDDHGLTYNRYQALKYLVHEHKKKYKNAELASRQLAFIMKTLLVKRIDSSFKAFKGSLNRFYLATGAMIQMFKQGKIYIAPNFNVTEFIVEGKEEELLDKLSSMIETDPTITFCTPKDFLPGFIEGLEKDYAILKDLVNKWDEVQYDPKFEKFLEVLKQKMLCKELNPDQKLVVFSESKETTSYLMNRLKGEGYSGILEVNSKNRKDKMKVVRENFDANLPKEKQKNDVQIIITTEVLAEGVNLHRSNSIVNYDTPWNATKLMQRIGRVNRIGSLADMVFIYNFYPTAKVDNDIELKKKAIMKLQAFHSALGEDSQIYSTEEEVDTFGLFDRNIEESRDERLAYLMELRKFKNENPKYYLRIKNMPLRARVGRKSKLLKGGTLTYIKNPKRDAFSYVDRDGEMEELSFTEAAKHFKAFADEKSVELHQDHHMHVNIATKDFERQLEEERSVGNVVDVNLSPKDKKVISFLSAFLKLVEVSEDQKAYIRIAKDAVRLGKFSHLTKKVYKLANAVRKTPMRIDITIEKLFEILEEFPLESIVDFPEEQKNHLLEDLTAEYPDIIISESFIK